MRRKDKAITDAVEINAIIAKAKVCRLAMVTDDKPYVVPLSFGYHSNSLYFHGSIKGRKIETIRKNPQVCFEFDQLFETLESEKACEWSVKYQSIIGFGRAILVEEQEEKSTALKIIMAQYSDQEFEFPDDMLKATAVIKVEIESMTGKQSGFGDSSTQPE
jgi:uncharacterized protein